MKGSECRLIEYMEGSRSVLLFLSISATMIGRRKIVSSFTMTLKR